MTSSFDSSAGAAPVKPAPEAENTVKKSSIEAMTLEILGMALGSYKTKKLEDSKKVQENQAALHQLHEILTKVNAMTDGKNGKITVTDELVNLIDQAKRTLSELDIDLTTANIVAGKTYTSDERQRLIENVRIASENTKTEVESYLSKVRETTNGYYEVLKLAMDIIKILDSPKKKITNAIGGR